MGRNTRKNKGRNPQNLHVINTGVYKASETVVPARDKESNSLIVLQTKPIMPAKTPAKHFTKLTKEMIQKNLLSLKKYKIKRKRQRRRRNRRSIQYGIGSNPYHWYNMDYKASNLAVQEDAENLEDVSDVPLEEGEFEEVEVAQINDTTKELKVPVGYRKYKPLYLKYRQKFYKAKFYVMPQERMVMNCSLAQSTSHVEVDVVSEAEYDDCEDSAYVSSKKEQNDIDNLHPLVDLSMSNVKVNTNDDFDIAEMCKDSNEKIHVDKKDSLMQLNKTEPVQRIYHCSLSSSDSTADFYGGCAIIQTALNNWNSHLIGLEYIVEVRYKLSEDSIKHYYCVLCEQDIQDICADSVILHIVKYKHMVKYLEKHFPSCGYKFMENNGSNSNEILLQKCCEEINSVCGFNCMCITYCDYFENHKEEIKAIINHSNHFSEGDFHLDVKKYANIIECTIHSEVAAIVNDVIAKITNDGEKSQVSADKSSQVGNVDQSEKEIAISIPPDNMLEKKTEIKDKNKKSSDQKPVEVNKNAKQSNYLKLLADADRLANVAKRNISLKKVSAKQNVLPKVKSAEALKEKKSGCIHSVSSKDVNSKFKKSNSLSSYLKQKYNKSKARKIELFSKIEEKTKTVVDVGVNSKHSLKENQTLDVLRKENVVETEEQCSEKIDGTSVKTTLIQKVVPKNISKSKSHLKSSLHSKHCPKTFVMRHLEEPILQLFKRILNKGNISKSSSGAKGSATMDAANKYFEKKLIAKIIPISFKEAAVLHLLCAFLSSVSMFS